MRLTLILTKLITLFTHLLTDYGNKIEQILFKPCFKKLNYYAQPKLKKLILRNYLNLISNVLALTVY